MKVTIKGKREITGVHLQNQTKMTALVSLEIHFSCTWNASLRNIIHYKCLIVLSSSQMC